MRHLAICLATISLAVPAAPALAISPQNPYRSFNLSGINYGSMQWERAQRQGKRVWPYYNVPSQRYGQRSSRDSGVVVGGVIAGGGGAGTIMQAGSSRPTPRSYSTRTVRRGRR